MSSRSESVIPFTSLAVMPSGGFLIYVCLSSSKCFGSIEVPPIFEYLQYEADGIENQGNFPLERQRYGAIALS